MIRASSPAGDHLTYTIVHVTAVDVLQDADGNDVALQITYEGGTQY